MNDIAKTLMLLGGVLFIFGALLTVFNKIPGFGKLPGDILIKKENITFYFPIATSLLLSIFLSLVLYLFNRR